MAAFCSAVLAVSMREAGFEQCLQQQAKKRPAGSSRRGLPGSGAGCMLGMPSVLQAASSRDLCFKVWYNTKSEAERVERLWKSRAG